MDDSSQPSDPSDAKPPRNRPHYAKSQKPPSKAGGYFDEVKRKFRIQRRRLGKIITLLPESQFGFIDSEDFREDVFFHRDVWEGATDRDGRTVQIDPEEGLWVEFELDDDRYEDEKRLRASIVRPTDRPVGRKLSGRDATFKIVTHHPRARRKRPSWRQ